jgi:hypothetical protein
MNYFPSPKSEFQLDPKNLEAHHVVVQNPAVRRGLEVALAQMTRQITDSAPPEMGACAAAHLRVLGAHDLLQIFYNLAETAAPTASNNTTNLPGNVRVMPQVKKN